MDDATQQNSALVEEASAAAQSLQDQASNLSQVVSVFKLDGLRQSANVPLKSVARTSHVAPTPTSSTSARARSARILATNVKPLKRAESLPPPAAGGDWEEF
jgi:methyl-accepting chemotaxis protein